MKIALISTLEEVKARFYGARQSGYLVFVQHDADPDHLLLDNKFLYVSSYEEMREKIALLQADPTIMDEVRKI